MLELDPDHATLVSSGMAGTVPPNRIAEIRAALGWSQERLAKACDPPTTQPQIDRLEKGVRKLTQGWMATLSKAFGGSVAPSDLLPANAAVRVQPVARRTVSDLDQHVRPDPMTAGVKDLPILGRAKGGDDAFYIQADGPIVKTVRPHLLDGVPDAYAVEVWDDSMHPHLRNGWMLWVHPRKPIKPGDAIIIQLHDGQALVKELVRRTDRDLIVRQYNPVKEYKIPRNTVESVHLVVGNTRGMM